MSGLLGRLVLPPEVTSVTRGRHYARDLLAANQAMELVDDAQLAVGELVANAVEHARTQLVLTLARDGDTLTVSVTDGHPEVVAPVHREPLAENGRGLRIIEALASEWGVEQHDDGKTLWFRLRFPPGRASAPVVPLHTQQSTTSTRAEMPSRSSSG